jgi:hypothetical protein
MAREKIAKKVYVLENGDEAAHASPDVSHLEFRFESGDTIIVRLEDIDNGCRTAAAWHGISQKLGDTYAGKDAAEAAEEVQSLLERLQSGDWIKAREGGGPRPTLVIEAIVCALIDNGEEVSDERRATIAAKVNTPTERKRALKQPAVQAHFERLKAERAADKAAKAAEDADGEVNDLSEF